MIPGNKIQIKPIIKDGLTSGLFPGHDQTKPHLSIYQSAGSFFDGCHPAYSGDILTVIDKPKRRGGINTAIVETAGGVQGHVYWCELRASCNHI